MRILKRDGWYKKKTRGSHVQLVHPDKPGKITVPFHKGDMDIGTARAILKQAGIDVREVLK